jgi:hypothetical protein
MVVKDIKPYVDQKIDSRSFIRKFNKEILSEEFKWHRDEKDRIVEILEGIDWEIQIDNELPKKIVKGECYFIPAKTYHRIKRGTTNLIVRIEEL